MPEHETHKVLWMTMSVVFVCRPIDANQILKKLRPLNGVNWSARP